MRQIEWPIRISLLEKVRAFPLEFRFVYIADDAARVAPELIRHVLMTCLLFFLFLAVAMSDNHGYWGPPTASNDFCEENYVVTYYIAEFWNVITSFGALPNPFNSLKLLDGSIKNDILY